MTDFLYTKKSFNESTLELFSDHYDSYPYKCKSFNGSWGCLYYRENHYRGYRELETDRYLALLIGGPLLKFCSNKYIYNNDSDSFATEILLNRWCQNKFIPEDDLSGPFVFLIVDKKASLINIYTDLMSFIPIWHYSFNNDFLISTLPECISENINLSIDSIDKSSLIEFIHNGTITFPYSLYKNIYQLSPAFRYTLKCDGSFEGKRYYFQASSDNNKPIHFYTKKLFSAVSTFVQELLPKDQLNYTSYFLSGGEDSRLIGSMIPGNNFAQALTLARSNNAELKISKKIAKLLGAKHHIYKKSDNHYFLLAKQAIKMIGSSGQYIHGHTLSLKYSQLIQNSNVILGGFASDRLLKGEHKAVHKLVSFLYLPKLSRRKDPHKEIILNSFPENFSKEIIKRQDEHIKRLSAFLSYSDVQEWMSIWPSSMAIGSTNFAFNRRIFRAYEPFFDNTVVKLSSQIPYKFKLNRRLFYKSFKSFYKKTFFVQHVEGWYPSLPSFINYFLSTPIKLFFLLSRIVFKTPHRSGWCDWKTLEKSQQYQNIKKDLISDNILYELDLASPESLNLLKFSTFQIFNLFQCNLILKNILKNKDQ